MVYSCLHIMAVLGIWMHNILRIGDTIIMLENKINELEKYINNSTGISIILEHLNTTGCHTMSNLLQNFYMNIKNKVIELKEIKETEEKT